MEYVGIHTQQVKNNAKTTALLVLFPIITLALVFLAILIFGYFAVSQSEVAVPTSEMWTFVWQSFLQAAPWTVAIVAVWFLIAYFANTYMISKATGSKPLARKENARVYNLVENLCMSKGMPMPKINVINDSSLNAFASGINPKTYTVTLTTGIMEKLDDAELEGVVGHELTHIRNHDVRLLIVSIVFVGIFSLLAQMAFYMLRYSSLRSSRNNKNGGGIIIILIGVMILAAIGYLITTLMKFAISRKREYMADAGSAEMTKNPLALASALRKISGDPEVECIKQNSVAQLFIEHPLKKKGGFSSLFATHPPIKKRIEILEQF